jgi:hypothetical protein
MEQHCSDRNNHLEYYQMCREQIHHLDHLERALLRQKLNNQLLKDKDTEKFK